MLSALSPITATCGLESRSDWSADNRMIRPECPTAVRRPQSWLMIILLMQHFSRLITAMVVRRRSVRGGSVPPGTNDDIRGLIDVSIDTGIFIVYL